MRQNLYAYLHQALVSAFLNGAYLPGQMFPSQRELCMRFNIGITTVRKVMKMLDEEGYVRTAKGQPSIVVYQAPVEKYILYLAQRRDEIADAYQGLGVVMPILCLEGAKRCTASEITYFRELFNGINDQMKLVELYQQVNTFFAVLLRSMNNQLIMDLELDSESFLHTPYIPSSTIKNPFDLTADRLRIWMKQAIEQIEKKRFHSFYKNVAHLYQDSAIRVDVYLNALGELTPAITQTKENIHWFQTKGRCELYARLAMTIIRRIVAGEFDEQKYLPSIPQLMEEYHVMKNTASRAIALLNTLGFVQTFNKKGTIVMMRDIVRRPNDINLSDPLIQERLALFLNALQIIALTAQSCGTVFSTVPENLAFFIEHRLVNAQKNRISPLSLQLLMNSFIQLLPCHSLKNIFQQLDELLLWGHYLQVIDPSLYPSTYQTTMVMEELVTAIKSKDTVTIAHIYGKAFTLIYDDVCSVISQIPACKALLKNRREDLL